MSKIWYLGVLSLVALALFVSSAFNISFNKKEVSAKNASVKSEKSCGCGAQSQCSGSCQAGTCKCGSACAMNKTAQ